MHDHHTRHVTLEVVSVTLMLAIAALALGGAIGYLLQQVLFAGMSLTG